MHKASNNLQINTVNGSTKMRAKSYDNFLLCREGYTVFSQLVYCACMQGATACIHAYLQLCLDLMLSHRTSNISVVRDNNIITFVQIWYDHDALMCAWEEGHLSMVQLLVLEGADRSFTNSEVSYHDASLSLLCRLP